MQIQQTLKPRGFFDEIARYQSFVVASGFVLPVRAVSKLLICGRYASLRGKENTK